MKRSWKTFDRSSMCDILYYYITNLSLFLLDMVSGGGRLNVAPDFDICDCEEQSALEHALMTLQYRLAEQVLEAGANIDLEDSVGCTLLFKTIRRKDVPSALFLIEHGADINVK